MKQKTGRKLLGFLLSLAMIMGLMLGMSVTALAETEQSETIATTAKIVNGTHFTISNKQQSAVNCSLLPKITIEYLSVSARCCDHCKV